VFDRIHAGAQRSGDPLKNIKELENVKSVMKGGFVYKNEMR